jgi:glycosyltransferase involved in cell wall biosynthesis
VIVVSRPLRERVVRLGFPAERVEVVTNGVDLERFPSADAGPLRDVPLVAYAGRFDEWQGVQNLVRLAAGAGRDYRLRVVGFGNGDAGAKARIAGAAAGGGSVELLDWTPQERLVPLLADADLLLIPREKSAATEVAMPTKFAEYLALGRPLLLTRVGEPAAIVERARCGLVVDPEPEALVAGVRRFAALPASERREMGRRGRGLAEREFRWPEIGRRYAEFLERLVASD